MNLLSVLVPAAPRIVISAALPVLVLAWLSLPGPLDVLYLAPAICNRMDGNSLKPDLGCGEVSFVRTGLVGLECVCLCVSSVSGFELRGAVSWLAGRWLGRSALIG